MFSLKLCLFTLMISPIFLLASNHYSKNYNFISSTDANQTCTDWPVITAGFGPNKVLNRALFHYNFRLNCDLGEKYQIGEFVGGVQKDESTFTTNSFIYDVVYQNPVDGTDVVIFRKLFRVPNEQPAGIYTIEGCVNFIDTLADESKCVPIIEKNIEIVRD